MAGLEAEEQGLIGKPIERGPKGIEFYDANGTPWDVKTPPSPKPGERWKFKTKKVGESILDELRNKVERFSDGTATPPGTYSNKKTGKPELRRVILDSTYMSGADHNDLWQWLNNNLTPDELNRIVEINTRQ